MNEDVKTRWVAALRSGEYTQTTGSLRKNDSFCCLGVLCNIAEQEGVGEWEENTDTMGRSSYFFKAFAVAGRDPALLPWGIADWAGITRGGSLNPRVDGVNSLAGLNDSGYTFGQIADVIERAF